MKGFEFNKEQLEAYKNGATMFIVPILKIVDNDLEYTNIQIKQPSKPYIYAEHEDSVRKKTLKQPLNKFIEQESPLQKGNEFFIQEDHIEGFEEQKEDEFKIWYKKDNDLHEWIEFEEEGVISPPWIPALQMQEHQARFKDVVLDVEVKKVEDFKIKKEWVRLIPNNGKKLSMSIAEFKEKNNINNDSYVFLYTVKGVNK